MERENNNNEKAQSQLEQQKHQVSSILAKRWMHLLKKEQKIISTTIKKEQLIGVCV